MLCLTYAFSPAVRDVENFNVKLFRTAISIVIVMTLLLQGVLTQVCSKHGERCCSFCLQVLTRPFREEGHDTTTRRFLFLAAR